MAVAANSMPGALARRRHAPYLCTMTEEARTWSQRVSETSHALDLEAGVFALDDPEAIAEALARAAEASTARKGTPLQSAMAMLNFYINRAGQGLDADRRAVLEQAKDELRVMHDACMTGS
jgi:hypothetical protein